MDRIYFLLLQCRASPHRTWEQSLWRRMRRWSRGRSLRAWRCTACWKATGLCFGPSSPTEVGAVGAGPSGRCRVIITYLILKFTKIHPHSHVPLCQCCELVCLPFSWSIFCFFARVSMQCLANENEFSFFTFSSLSFKPQFIFLGFYIIDQNSEEKRHRTESDAHTLKAKGSLERPVNLTCMWLNTGTAHKSIGMNAI